MKFLKNKLFLACLLAAVCAAAYFVFSKKPEFEYTTAKVTRGALAQTVSQTGVVKSAEEIELGFVSTGRITDIFAHVGDKIKKDQALALLDSGDLLLKEKQAAANLQVSQANLAKILAGATSHELAVSKASADQAKTAYESALNEQEKIKNAVNENIAQAEKKLSNLYLTSGETITSYQQTVKNYKTTALITADAKIAVAANALDNIITVLTDSDAKYFLGAGDASYIKSVQSSYDAASAVLSQAKSAQNSGSASAVLEDTLNVLDKTFKALKNCYGLLEVSMAGANFTQTELDAFKTAISAQQANVSAGISAAQAAENNLNDAQNNLNNAISDAKDDLADAKASADQQTAASKTKVDTYFKALAVSEAQLSQLKAGARVQDVNLARAQVSQAQAALDLIRKQISDNSIKAPIDCVVTKRNYEAGEQFLASKPVFLLSGMNNFEIEADVSEADIAKISIGNPVDITLDAFGEDIKFGGQVIFIEPAETVIQDVIYYKIKISFDGQGKDIKPGMTANANIMSAKKENILVMPSRAVIERNHSGKFARLLVSGQIKEMPVSLGMRGDGGLVEILSGLNENDIVVTYIQQNK